MNTDSTRQQVLAALAACEAKKAEAIAILEMDKATSAFTDYFVICSGTNPRQIQAIADEVELRLKGMGQRPTHIEGYQKAEWVLLDYLDFVVHIFAPQARAFYDLERLWKSAKHVTRAELTAPRKAVAAGKKTATAGSAASSSRVSGAKRKSAAKPAAKAKKTKVAASVRSRSAKRHVRKSS